jgi:hypothetical protein
MTGKEVKGAIEQVGSVPVIAMQLYNPAESSEIPDGDPLSEHGVPSQTTELQVMYAPLAESLPPASFVVFEAESCTITTPDSRGLLCGVQPLGSGEWDVTVEATLKTAHQKVDSSIDNATECSLESVMLDVLGCDYKYVCPIDGYQSSTCDHEPKWSHQATGPCACWQGQTHRPRNAGVSVEWDGNSGSVCWETDTHFFDMSYSTS